MFSCAYVIVPLVVIFESNTQNFPWRDSRTQSHVVLEGGVTDVTFWNMRGFHCAWLDLAADLQMILLVWSKCWRESVWKEVLLPIHLYRQRISTCMSIWVINLVSRVLFFPSSALSCFRGQKGEDPGYELVNNDPSGSLRSLIITRNNQGPSHVPLRTPTGTSSQSD